MKHKIWIKATLLAASTLTVMAGAAIAPALPKIGRAFADVPNADFLTKLILTTPALFIALFAPIAGWMIDRFGKLRLFAIAMVVYSAAGTAGLYLENIYWLLASRALLGMSVAIVMTTATTLIGDYFSGGERSGFLGIQGAFMAFGGTVFVAASGLLADYSWRYPFAIYGLSVVVLLLTLLFLYEPESTYQESGAKRQRLPKAKRRSVGVIYFATFVGMAFFYMVPVQLPFLMERIGVTQSSKASIGLVLITLAAASVAAYYRRISLRLSFRQIYIIVFMMMGIGYGLVSLANSLAAVGGSMIVAGLGAGLLMPNGNLSIIAYTPPGIRGKVLGGLTGAVFTGQFLSPILFQPLVDQFSIRLAFQVAALVSVAMGLALVWPGILRPPRKANTEAPSPQATTSLRIADNKPAEG